MRLTARTLAVVGALALAATAAAATDGGARRTTRQDLLSGRTDGTAAIGDPRATVPVPGLSADQTGPVVMAEFGRPLVKGTNSGGVMDMLVPTADVSVKAPAAFLDDDVLVLEMPTVALDQVADPEVYDVVAAKLDAAANDNLLVLTVPTVAMGH